MAASLLNPESVYVVPCETCMLGLQKYPGSSGAKKLWIPNCFVSVLNVFGSPTRFATFPLPVHPSTDRQTMSKVVVQYFPSLCRKMASSRHLRRCLTPPRQMCWFNIPWAYAEKWTWGKFKNASVYVNPCMLSHALHTHTNLSNIHTSTYTK